MIYLGDISNDFFLAAPGLCHFGSLYHRIADRIGKHGRINDRNVKTLLL